VGGVVAVEAHVRRRRDPSLPQSQVGRQTGRTEGGRRRSSRSGRLGRSFGGFANAGESRSSFTTSLNEHPRQAALSSPRPGMSLIGVFVIVPSVIWRDPDCNRLIQKISFNPLNAAF